MTKPDLLMTLINLEYLIAHGPSPEQLSHYRQLKNECEEHLLRAQQTRAS